MVHIVSRESQRLNQIITDFLDYSREKTYHFADIDVVALFEETLLLLEHDATAAGKPHRAGLRESQVCALARTATR